MATPMVKTTYSLDVETIRTLDDLARRWNVSRSQALRRAIRAAAGGEPSEVRSALEALDEAQRSLGLTPEAARRWEKQVKEERRASSRKAEGRAG